MHLEELAKPRAPGRPRSQAAHNAILSAAQELLIERGPEGLTIDDIAAHAKVGKNTIYRWWPNKAAILMDAFASATKLKLEFPEGATAWARLSGQVRNVVNLMNEPTAKLPFLALVAASLQDPEVASALRERFISMRRAKAIQILTDGVISREFSQNLASDVAVDMIYGAIYYRLFVSGEALDELFVSELLITAKRLLTSPH